MITSDPFDYGMISPEDIKNVFSALIPKLQTLPYARQDLWMEYTENAKHELIALCERNAQIFVVKRKESKT